MHISSRWMRGIGKCSVAANDIFLFLDSVCYIYINSLFISDLHTEQVYDSLFLLFSRCSCLQLLSSDLHNSLFLISHLPAESVSFLLYFCLTSFLLICDMVFHHAVTHDPIWPIQLCLRYHIVFKIFLSSWTVRKISSFVFLSFQLIFSKLLLLLQWSVLFS